MLWDQRTYLTETWDSEARVLSAVPQEHVLGIFVLTKK